MIIKKPLNIKHAKIKKKKKKEANTLKINYQIT